MHIFFSGSNSDRHDKDVAERLGKSQVMLSFFELNKGSKSALRHLKAILRYRRAKKRAQGGQS